MAYYLTTKIKQEIGKNIKKIRRYQKQKQVDMAVEAGINPSYYSKIERGQVNPSLDKLYKIIKSLKAKSSDVLPF